MKYENILRAVAGQPWMISEGKARQMLALLELRAAGGLASPETVAQVQATNAEREARTIEMASAANGASGGAVAVIPLVGIMSQRSMVEDVSGPSTVSTQKFGAALRQLVADPQVKTIIVDVDSPGGSVYGVDELATEIFAARGQKDIVAVANSLMASAAYYSMAQAAEVVVTPGGEVGSIGVLALHDDISEALALKGIKPTLVTAGKFKAEFSPDFPLTEEARAHLQEEVDRYYGMFLKAVARGRGTTAAAVRGGFGEGRVVGAPEAVRLGMADRVATLEETVRRFVGGGKVGRKAAASAITVGEAAAGVTTSVASTVVLADAPDMGQTPDDAAARDRDLAALDLALLS